MGCRVIEEGRLSMPLFGGGDETIVIAVGLRNPRGQDSFSRFNSHIFESAH